MRYLKCKEISAMPGWTFCSFKTSTKLLANEVSNSAKSDATVRHTTAGSLSKISPRLKKKRDPSWRRSVNLDTKLDAMADLPEPGHPLNQRTSDVSASFNH